MGVVHPTSNLYEEPGKHTKPGFSWINGEVAN